MNKNLKAFRNDVEVPEKVRTGVEDTLASIRKEPINKPERNTDSRRYLHFFKSQAAAAACVAVLAAGGITAAAAGYHLWSRGIENSLQATDSQKEAAESSGLADNPKDSDGNVTSVEHDGITVSVEQTIVDNYRAVIALKIHGLVLADDEDPAVGTVTCDIDGVDSNWSGSFANGTIMTADGRSVYPDGSEIDWSEAHPLHYEDENGDYEYDLYFDNNGEAGAMIGKTIHVTIGDFGADTSANYKAPAQGEWKLNWTLKGSSEIRKTDLDEKIGDTGATVKSVEISPISARITMDWPYQEITEKGINEDNGETIESTTFKEAPALRALLMKDGTVNMEAVGWTAIDGYDDDSHKTYVAQVNFQRIIDPDEVSELLFMPDELFEKLQSMEDGTASEFISSLTADDFDRVALK